jgi:aminopeptidase YwaD
MAPGRSTNIVADLPGTDRDDEVVCVSAHHDTQAASAGADDNASGVAGLLELARVLAGVARRRRLRLISFGAEEQLSVGSATYVRAHRDVVSRHATLMLNLDSYGSWMGWTEIVYTGATELERYLRTAFEEVGLYPRLTPTVVPYADHFPFAAAGVPAVCVTRANCTGGRFFHHRPDDDLTRVSPAVMAGHLTAVAHVATDLLQRDEMPFPSGIPVSQRADVEACWNDLFGGWDPPRS